MPKPYLSTLKVAEFTGLTLRQLQWWDEQKILSPKHGRRERLYSPTDAVIACTMARLRKQGVSFQGLRKFASRLSKALTKHDARYVVIDDLGILTADSPIQVCAIAKETTGPVHIINLSDYWTKVLEP